MLPPPQAYTEPPNYLYVKIPSYPSGSPSHQTFLREIKDWALMHGISLGETDGAFGIRIISLSASLEWCGLANESCFFVNNPSDDHTRAVGKISHHVSLDGRKIYWIEPVVIKWQPKAE